MCRFFCADILNAYPIRHISISLSVCMFGNYTIEVQIAGMYFNHVRGKLNVLGSNISTNIIDTCDKETLSPIYLNYS